MEKDYEALSKRAASIVASQVVLKPQSVLGLATGSTPVGMYKKLINLYQQGDLDFSQVVTFNLDEYYQLPVTHQESYHFFMHEKLFAGINVRPENIHIPNGNCADITEECADYDKAIKEAGGIDLQVLGIGVNGHIGFIEPADKLSIGTNLIDLSAETIESNSRFFNSGDEVPKQAVTVGLGTILKARRIVLLANGEKKAAAIKETVSGYVTTQTPSSLLQIHPDVTLVLDEEAAKLI